MADEAPRSRAARRAAEAALVRVVHHYGARPEFVVLGGLVPELLCAGSAYQHAGTTDVDVQVNLEIAGGSLNTRRLEQALTKAGFKPDNERVWRWVDRETTPASVVKFELLADLADQPAGSTVRFDQCDRLGAANLRGSGFAARDTIAQALSGSIDGVVQTVDVTFAGLAGFLLAKAAAAHSRRKSKDWYDIAFVLLHNRDGGPTSAVTAVRTRFARELVGTTRRTLDDLLANFQSSRDQGPEAYVSQMLLDHPDADAATLAADAILAVETFHAGLFGGGSGRVSAP